MYCAFLKLRGKFNEQLNLAEDAQKKYKEGITTAHDFLGPHGVIITPLYDEQTFLLVQAHFFV